MILSQLVVVRPQTVDLLLPLGVGVDQPHDGVPQLVVEGVAGIVGGIEIVVHPAACKIKNCPVFMMSLQTLSLHCTGKDNSGLLKPQLAISYFSPATPLSSPLTTLTREIAK